MDTMNTPMLLISHRGNLEGPDPSSENDPNQISKVLSLGFQVEVDVWWHDGRYLLGYGLPKYPTTREFLLQSGVWCHAMNREALRNMLDDGIHCFWHETDRYTLTSRGIPWGYPFNYCKGGIVVTHPPYLLPLDLPKEEMMGICTDYPLTLREMLLVV